jgi:Ni,Fe-hydrogenase III small subunit/ferredoxin
MDMQAKIPPVPMLRLYRINAGSCNGCDVELAATAALSRFCVEQLGCSFTEDPTHADIVLITGPLTVRVREKVLHSFAQVPDPKVTVALGVCPISGGVFRDSYAVSGPLDSYLRVDVNVPGCPPRPQAIVAGIEQAVHLWRTGRHGDLCSPGTIVANAPDSTGHLGPDLGRVPDLNHECSGTSQPGLRGKMHFNAAACVGCRMCEHVCAGGAIRFEEMPGGLKFTLWHNSCAFCGLCSHYCPTKALAATGEWQLAHLQQDKYRQVEQGIVPLVPCSGCGTPMLPVAPELLRAAYRSVSRETAELQKLCTECRQQRNAQLTVGTLYPRGKGPGEIRR